jgi:hypothetical protein
MNDVGVQILWLLVCCRNGLRNDDQRLELPEVSDNPIPSHAVAKKLTMDFLLYRYLRLLLAIDTAFAW